MVTTPFSPPHAPGAQPGRRLPEQHRLYEALHAEIHARPFPRLQAPLRASFLAVLTGEGGRAADLDHLRQLASQCGAPAPQIAAGSRDSFAEVHCGELTVRFERHTEFCTYTFYRCGAFEHPFAGTALDLVPPTWLATMPGEVVSACHLALQQGPLQCPDMAELHSWFDDHRLIASHVVEANASLWTALQLHGDGFGRYYIQDHSLTDCRAGRLVQRLFELETYRALALLSLPLAREVGPELSECEAQIGSLMCTMVEVQGLEAERALLTTLTTLAARVEKLRTRCSYRFGATDAYAHIMQRRLEALREEQVAGFQTVGEFLERRVEPALRTCQSVTRRAESLSERLDRTGDLLRTRIDLTLEAQNQAILASVERRADLQLRLQETVEGLSLAAIAYYLFQLLHYLPPTLVAWGLKPPGHLLEAISLPIAIAVAVFKVRHARHHLRRSVATAGQLKGPALPD